MCWRRAQIEDIRVYTTSPVGYRVRQQLGMESADRICATLFALFIVLVIVREFYRQVHIEQRRSGPTAEHIASRTESVAPVKPHNTCLWLWPVQEMCALIVITCLSVLCLSHHLSSAITWPSHTLPTCCSIKVRYSARDARSSELCPTTITISIGTFHTRAHLFSPNLAGGR